MAPNSTATPEVVRFCTLDGMRGVAAIAVMFHHLTQHTSGAIFSNAGLAVDLFFCLSGFVVAFSYLPRLQSSMSVRDFLLRRLVRLYPMFLVGLGLGSVALLLKVLGGQTDLSVHQTLSAISLNTFYLPYLSDFDVQVGKDKVHSPIFPTNNPSWSLFFEFAVNIVFGVFAFRARKRYVLALAILGMLGMLAYEKLTWEDTPGWGAANIVGGIPRTVFGFFSGVFLFLIYDRYRRFLPAIHPVYIIAALLFVFLIDWRIEHLWLGTAIALVPLLVAIGSTSNPQGPALTRAFDYLGWISYPVYCLHYPIYSMYTLLTGNGDSRIPVSLVCVPIAIGLSHVVARHVEEPARRILAERCLAAR